MKYFILLVFGFCMIVMCLQMLSACECMNHGTPIEELNKATVVFIGKVINIQLDSLQDPTFGFVYHVYRVKFFVLGYWKGITTTEYELFNNTHVAACGYPFQLDSSYIVYGYDEHGNIFTSICRRTTDLAFASEDINTLGPPTLLGVPIKDEIIPHFELYQNFPNPFNPITSISYELSKRSSVELIIYDILGQQVITLVNEEKDAGKHSVIFEAGKLAGGVYFYRLQAGSFEDRKKLILIR